MKLIQPDSELRPEVALQIHYTQASGITGHFMLLIMVLMWVESSRVLLSYQAFFM